ncbi:uncharacterized protein LOC130130910 [Lampris incognitus]|uniref:uncharacterized protein LOC130130910 n=1 Tax=Lampris incognitus TaxID=2546036 RepID=UPI0024B5E240|nr:uncharacterized protein LOC130130910 [Lampris incognitus]
MSISPLVLPLLLLLLHASRATHFYGTVMTFDPKDTQLNGAVTVKLRYKLNFRECRHSTSWGCLSGNCGTLRPTLQVVDEEDSGEWCQREGVMTQQLPNNAPFQLRLSGGNWISSIQNGIVAWRALTLVDLRNRSDTGRANRSPQTTILPAIRVPSNCARNFSLLTFDPDGDQVKCRNGSTTAGECNPCTPPSVLNLDPSCTLSFRPTNSSGEGPYAVQLVMEDFPNQSVTLTHTSGSQTNKTTSDPLSKLPVQFVVRVDPSVPSCSEGQYLPRFLPPTPAHRAQLYVPVGHTLLINVSTEATHSTVSDLLFSGPHNVIKSNTSVPEQFILSWTPTESENGENQPICFVVQALNNSRKYHSELRCVIVTVGIGPATTAEPSTTVPPGNATSYVVGLRVRLSSTTPLTDDDIGNVVLQQIKEQLVGQGLPADIALRLKSIS